MQPTIRIRGLKSLVKSVSSLLVVEALAVRWAVIIAIEEKTKKALSLKWMLMLY